MGQIWEGLLDGLGSVLSFFYDVIPSYGIAIILLTIFVRILLLPLTIKQTRSMQGMQKIQPKVKELQRKYKGNRQKLNEELMKLYKEHQVNPLGGCLPLLLQIPVFIALFWVLTRAPAGEAPGTQYLPDGDLKASIVGGSERFLGMNLACSPSQALNAEQVTALDCGAGGLEVVPFFIMIALMVGTMFYQSKQMQRNATGPQAQQMKIMTTIMPVFLGFISFNIAAGVLVYWVTTNTWQIAQQTVMLRRREEEPLTVKGSPKAAPKAAPKASGDGVTQKSIQSGNPGRTNNARSRKKRRKR